MNKLSGWEVFTDDGRDPLARFESCMADVPAVSVEKFNSGNFLRVVPSAI